jgi:hypothetical protein
VAWPTFDPGTTTTKLTYSVFYWWLILRLIMLHHYVCYVTSMKMWMVNCENEGRTACRLLQDTTPLFPCRGWGSSILRISFHGILKKLTDKKLNLLYRFTNQLCCWHKFWSFYHHIFLFQVNFVRRKNIFTFTRHLSGSEPVNLLKYGCTLRKTLKNI